MDVLLIVLSKLDFMLESVVMIFVILKKEKMLKHVQRIVRHSVEIYFVRMMRTLRIVLLIVLEFAVMDFASLQKIQMIVLRTAVMVLCVVIMRLMVRKFVMGQRILMDVVLMKRVI